MAVSPREIVYVTVDANYIKLTLVNNRIIPARYSLTEFKAHLPPEDFVRTHRNYIVSIRHIDSVGRSIATERDGEKTKEGEIIMKNGHTIPLSERCKKQVFACFKQL
ncbi:response regulator receiver protein [Chitinophaga pinensis DSM 2588]|uniref:Response regulator receiver protein n=2 Tax=Chitinophaga pinensis TaxID=79329 RepID=A0A979G7M2_CHIPD|nr:response regulator receiver protein [Chitinophaga pinensis DSM 2588]